MPSYSSGVSRPVDLPLTPEAFRRFKVRLEREGFDIIDTGMAERLVEACRDFGPYRIKAVAALSPGASAEAATGYPYKAEAKFILTGRGADFNLPTSLTIRAFPHKRHGNIALAHENVKVEGIAGDTIYRSMAGTVRVSNDVDFSGMLKAAEEILKARAEAKKIIERMSSAIHSKSDDSRVRAALDAMVRLIREDPAIAAAIEEYVPDL
ncbi:MAG: hypothetical protein AB1324_08105 [Candidatus Micrarchaeota archaeon]